MIERVYMGVDGRRDHSFRIPRPDLFLATGAPNACTDCHTDRNSAWAAAEIAQRFPDSDRRGPHFSQTFAAARHDPAASAENLLGIAEHDGLPGVIRASALDLLRVGADEAIAARAAPLIDDDDPLIRAAAIAVQRGAPPIDRVQRLVPAFEDPVRSVRIAAAREFLDAPVARLPARIAEAARSATGEWRASLFAKADFPETHMVIGGAALVLRNPRAAEQAFREAVRLDPQQVEAWTMIARILAATGDPDGARTALDDALAANPSSEVLQSLIWELNK
jgi:tetratricopeptide (TPR) repeat protein